MDLRFCSECGNPLQDGDLFCGSCGHRFESKLKEEAQPAQETQRTEEPQHIAAPKVPKKPGMTKKKKIGIGILAVIAIALFSAHTYIKSIISTENQVVLLHEAFHEGSSEKLFEVIHVDEDVIYDPQSYMELLKHNGTSTMVEDIVDAIQKTENTRLPQFITSYLAGDVLKVEREKYLGIYNKIKITALAYEVKLETDLPSGKITIGDKEWELKGEPINLGRFLPSHYPVLFTNEDLDRFDFRRKHYGHFRIHETMCLYMEKECLYGVVSTGE